MLETSAAEGRSATRFVAPFLLAILAVLLAGLVAGSAAGFVSAQLTRTQAWWLVMAAAGLGLVSATVATAWRRAGLIAAVGLVGASSQLALTQPEWFQFVWIQASSIFSYVFWLVIGLQGLVTLAALAMRSGYTELFRDIRALGVLKTALAAALLFSVSFGALRMIGDNDARGLVYQFILAGGFLGINFLTLAALARSLPEDGLARAAQRLDSLVTLPRAVEASRPLDCFLPLMLAVWVFVACALIAIIPLQRVPHIADELAYLYQAKYFSEGLLSLPPPSAGAVKALDLDLLTIMHGRWISVFPPGWPAVLTLGVWLGVPWLVNPLLGAFSIVAGHAVVRRLTSRGLANLVVVLMAASPWFLATSASMMSHTLTLALALGGWWLLLRARDKGSMLAALGAGAAMGLMFLARPVDGLIVGALTGLWTLTFLTDRRQWRTVILYGLGCILIGALVFPYNYQLAGDPLLSPVNAFFDTLWHHGSNRMGFGADIGAPASDKGWRFLDPWPGHDPVQAAIWTQLAGYSLNVELFGWGTASLLLVVAHMVWGRWTKLDTAMGVIVAAIVGAYALYWFNDGVAIGPRYWFTAFFPLVLLSARGAVTLLGRLEAHGGPEAGRRFGAILLVLMVFGLGSFTTWRASTKYFEFLGIHDGFRAYAHQPDLAHALVVVDAQGDKEQFHSAYLFNDLHFPRDRPIFANDAGEASNRALAAAFPDRAVYFMLGKTADGKPVRITRGPVRLTPQGWVAATTPEAAGRTHP
jgi:hypothetical protein